MTMDSSAATLPSMHSFWKRLVILLVVAVVGFVVGMLIRGKLQSAVPENASGSFQASGPNAGEPEPLPGWCCKAFGNTCMQSPDPITCLQSGDMFHLDKASCDQICQTTKWEEGS